MSFNQINAINLGATPDEIRAAVKKVYTDSLHLRVQDAGHLEGNVAFTYLDTFDPDQDGLAQLKAHYVRGGIADSVVKSRLEECLQTLLAPIRERRERFAQDRSHIMRLLKEGTCNAREVVARTTDEVKDAFGLRYF